MPQAWLEDTRKAWEREANEALERAGYGGSGLATWSRRRS